MALYKDNLDFVPHNFNSTTITLTGEDGEPHNVQALNSLEVARKESRWSTQEVASGVSIDVENPATAGTVKMTFLEASPTTDWLNAHIDDRIRLVISDANSPNLNCSGSGYLTVHAPVKRSAEVDTPEWELSIKYLKIRGGSYRLVTES
jgi:hypothetical protein